MFGLDGPIWENGHVMNEADFADKSDYAERLKFAEGNADVFSQEGFSPAGISFSGDDAAQQCGQAGRVTMRRRWQTLGVLLAGLVSLGAFLAPAAAQYPPAEAGAFQPPGPPPGDPAASPGSAALSIKDDGTPNAFTDLLTYRPRAINADPYILSFRSEYLNWQVTNGGSSAVLVTTTTNFPPERGALTEPNTIRYVDSSRSTFDYEMLRGYRLTLGVACAYAPPIELSGFWFNRTLPVFSAGSLTNPIFLAIPIQDLSNIIFGNTGTQTSEIIAQPGSLGGALSITSQFSFWDIEATAVLPLGDSDVLKLDFLLGYRHLQLDETLDINTQHGGPLGTFSFLGTTLPAAVFVASTNDHFQTRNSFDGGQVGYRVTFAMGPRLALTSDMKMGLGANSGSLTVDGNSRLTQLVGGRIAASAPGGILALPSNSGTFTSTDFSFVSEGNIALSCQLNSHMRIFSGFNFIYWTNVLRPGDATTNAVDKRQIPIDPSYTANVTYNGPNPPSLVHRDFFTRGLFFGFEIGF